MSFLSRFFKAKEPAKPEPVGPIQKDAELGDDAEHATEEEKISRPPKGKSWIGVDLDGTLAYYNGWEGFEHVGKPVPEMLIRVKEWIAQGYDVRIFTARASQEEGIQPVKDWLAQHRLPDLQVTCSKDFDMIECWDDRGVQVVPNSGQPVLSSRFGALPRAPLIGIEHRKPEADAMHAEQGTKPKLPKKPGEES